MSIQHPTFKIYGSSELIKEKPLKNYEKRLPKQKNIYRYISLGFAPFTGPITPFSSIMSKRRAARA